MWRRQCFLSHFRLHQSRTDASQVQLVKSSFQGRTIARFAFGSATLARAAMSTTPNECSGESNTGDATAYHNASCHFFPSDLSVFSMSHTLLPPILYFLHQTTATSGYGSRMLPKSSARCPRRRNNPSSTARSLWSSGRRPRRCARWQNVATCRQAYTTPLQRNAR